MGKASYLCDCVSKHLMQTDFFPLLEQLYSQELRNIGTCQAQTVSSVLSRHKNGSSRAEQRQQPRLLVQPTQHSSPGALGLSTAQSTQTFPVLKADDDDDDVILT